jgi:hypothetical protein
MTSTGGFLLFALLAFVAWQLYKGFRDSGDTGKRHCMTCGVDAKPARKIKGSMAVEIILWICFIVPGLIYSIWRSTSRFDACSACGSTQIVPLTAPAAITHKEVNDQKRCPDCAELVQAQARICKHCSFKFPESAAVAAAPEPALFSTMNRR